MGIRKGILKEEQGIKKENLGAEGFFEDIMIKKGQTVWMFPRKENVRAEKTIKESQAERIGEEEITEKVRGWERKQEYA